MTKWSTAPAFFALLALQSSVSSAETAVASNSSFQFVKEYVRELGSLEEIRARSEAEVKANPTDFATCIRNNETWILELQADSRMMKQTRLMMGKDVNQVPNMIAAVYDQKAKLLGKISDICTLFLKGPAAGVDYGSLGAKVPKITAQIQFGDKTLFDGTGLVFGAIWSNRVDSHGHVSFLSITGRQRDDLLKELEIWFPQSKTKGNDGYAQSAAEIFRQKLKEFRSSDGR